MGVVSWSRQVELQRGETQSVSFQPGGAQVVIHALSQTADDPKEPLVDFSIALIPYGGSKAVAVARYDHKTGGALLTYPLTVRQGPPVVLPGWTCELRNQSSESITIELTISSILTETVSFDIPLLNVMLAEALRVAGVKVHIHSNDGEGTDDSYVTWSDALAHLLQNTALAGKTGLDFHVPTVGIPGYRAVIDGDGAPTEIGLGNDGTVPCLRFVAQLAGNAVAPIGSGSLERCTITVTVRLMDAKFDATCDVHAVLGLGGGSIDISGVAANGISSAVVAAAQPYQPLIKTELDVFFSKLLRLEPVQWILGYATIGDTLTIEALSPPLLPDVRTTAAVHA